MKNPFRFLKRKKLVPPVPPMSLKERKEAFVSGHVGTTAFEVLLVSLSAPIGVACFQAVVSKLAPNNNKPFKILLEALLIWIPMIVCQTNLLYPYGISILTIQSLIAWLLFKFPTKPSESTSTIISSSTKRANQRLEYLTMYRSSLLYLTFIAILAVDFQLFPRRFAKTEVSGYGFMDIGAASFVFSAGLVSPKARKSSPDTSFSIQRQLFHAIPLFLMGILRLVTNKGLEYQEHVSEYGVHWNFFFTLGVVTLVTALTYSVVPKPTWLLPLGLMIGYQIVLSTLGVQTYIQEAPRTCVVYDHWLCHGFAANREGIWGCVGYLVIYWFGEVIAYSFLWNPSPGRISLLQLACWSWIFHWNWTIIWLVPVSRRSTNSSFCTWTVAHNVLLLGVFQAVGRNTMPNETPTKHSALPIVMDTVNQYGLSMFIIANLLTGLVNLSFPTLDVTDGHALMILFGYLCLVGLAAMVLSVVYPLLMPSKNKVLVGKDDTSKTKES